MHIADFALPDTAATRAARDLVSRYQSADMVGHVYRSWLWAEGFGAVAGLTGIDHELLHVAAVLHDIGLATEFDNHTTSYEHAGGHVGVAMAAGSGWPADRQQRLLDVIVRHNWPAVDPALDVEGHLLERATGLDITGADHDVLPEDFMREVVAAFPRGAVAREFGACVVDQAARKPTTAARRLVDNGIVERLEHNPLGRF